MRSGIKIFYLKGRAFFLKTAKRICLRHAPDAPSHFYGIRKILFIRNDRIGDLVLSTPALKAIKDALPGSSLTVLASRDNHPILFNNPYVDEIIVHDSSASLAQQLVFAKRLRNRHFDLVIDPLTDYDLRTAVLAFMTQAAVRIGYPGFGREVFFNLVAAPIDTRRHIIDLVLALPALIGAVVEDRSPQIFLSKDELNWANQWIARGKSESRKLVGIHPGGYYKTQRWPQEYYAELATALHRQGDCFVIIFGGRQDAALIESIVGRTTGNVAVFLDPDLRKTAAVMSLLDILVCNNSGPLHLAAALSVPTVSFMGPTVKSRWMPLGENHKVLRQDHLECIGCNRGTCARGDLACMKLIKPERAHRAILRLLKAAQ